jgi:hypothetical protein
MKQNIKTQNKGEASEMETTRDTNKPQFKVIIDLDGEITEHIFDNKNSAKMKAHNYNLSPKCVAKVIPLPRYRKGTN